MDCWTLNIKALRCFETSGTTRPTTQRHIPEEWNLEQPQISHQLHFRVKQAKEVCSNCSSSHKTKINNLQLRGCELREFYRFNPRTQSYERKAKCWEQLLCRKQGSGRLLLLDSHHSHPSLTPKYLIRSCSLWELLAEKGVVCYDVTIDWPSIDNDVWSPVSVRPVVFNLGYAYPRPRAISTICMHEDINNYFNCIYIFQCLASCKHNVARKATHMYVFH